MARAKGAAAALPAWLKAVEQDPAFGWALAAWRKAAAVEGAWFDHAQADAVVEIWPQLFKLTQDRFSGLPFVLAAWQEIIVRLLVGWRRPDEQLDPLTHAPATYHVRVFRRLLLWVPRKNGKSEFLAALALFFWIVDGVTDGEGYCFARDEKQAGIVLRKMKAMVALNDEWAGEVLTHKRSMWLKSLRSGFEMLTGAEEGKHGASPTVVVGDEMHEWRSRVIANTLEEGTGARLEPVFLYGSTAGPEGNPAGDELWGESRAILAGQIPAPSTLVCIFAADPDDDPFDVATWRKANPNLGLSLSASYLREAAEKAAASATGLARFKCYHLNVWVEADVRWFDLKKWDASGGPKGSWKGFPETLRGRRCFGACDVSATQDITALAWLFPPADDDPKWSVIVRFWVPEDTFAERIKSDRGAPYADFHKAGALELTPGGAVDQNYVAKAILEGLEAFDVQGLGFDPWNTTKLKSDLERDGVAADLIFDVRQGIPSLGEASKHVERWVLLGQLDHGANPVLRWMAGNVSVRFDENMNFAPAKKRSREKIDGIAALVTAAALATAGDGEAQAVNPWEDENFSMGAAA